MVELTLLTYEVKVDTVPCLGDTCRNTKVDILVTGSRNLATWYYQAR